MKPIFLALALSAIFPGHTTASDADQPESKRFKVSYVDNGNLPLLTVISKELDGRKEALEEDERFVAGGLDAARLEVQRRATLQQMYFPIRVEDLKNGNIYEVQTDRRTIVAKAKDGKELWKVDPFVDSGMKLPLWKADFHKHPYICYFGPPWSKLRSENNDLILQITFSSGEFGGFDIDSGKFTLWGSD